ncbi:MAG: DUF6452 family protein [Candidatus Cyclobacteriaceae bacterium M3_2C_046]
MNYFPRYLLFICLAGGLVFLASCYDDSDCVTEFAPYININFKKNIDRLDTIPPVLRIGAINSDSLFFNRETDSLRAKYVLPLNLYEDQTRFFFDFASSQQTLLVIYNRQIILENPDCGLVNIFDLDSVNTTFGSARIIEEIPKFPDEESNEINIEILL